MTLVAEPSLRQLAYTSGLFLCIIHTDHATTDRAYAKVQVRANFLYI